MKIDQNLRAAIRSFCASSNRNINRGAEIEAERRAVDDFVAQTPALQKWVKRADKLHKRIDAMRKKAGELEEKTDGFVKPFGLRVTYQDKLVIDDYEAFSKAGGKIEIKTSRSADAVISQLAAATPEEGAKILADLGIKWE